MGLVLGLGLGCRVRVRVRVRVRARVPVWVWVKDIRLVLARSHRRRCAGARRRHASLVG